MRTLTQRTEFGQVRQGCVLTIGNFDGVHLGHQEIFRTARRIARERGAEMVVMTFEPHPVAILHPEKAPGVLTPLSLKLHLLEEYADNCIIVLEDDKHLLSLSPEAFVDEFLMATIRPSVIVEGDDFHFGAARAGDVKTLAEFGRGKGFEVVVRFMLEGGHVAEAAAALSRPYRLLGPIVSGWGRGRKLGFPTLNMQTPRQILPAEGVYAGFVKTAGSEQDLLREPQQVPAVFSIGQARTFGDEHPLLIEAHLLIEGVGDMTGRWMAMDFVERLRGQHKFGSPEELVTQIAKDCGEARAILEKHHSNIDSKDRRSE